MIYNSNTNISHNTLCNSLTRIDRNCYKRCTKLESIILEKLYYKRDIRESEIMTIS